METLNLFANIASIASLILAIFVTTQVVSIKKNIQKNSTNNALQTNSKVAGDMAGRDIRK